MRWFARRKSLWLTFVAVLLPLGALLGLQYSWLVDLEKKSAIAEKAYLQNYLEAVSNKVETFYQTQAERALNIPVYYAWKDKEKIARYFRKKQPEGASYLFVARYDRGKFTSLRLFNSRYEPIDEPSDYAVMRAVNMAIAPFEGLCPSDPVLSAGIPTVDQRDPDHQVIVRPLTDDSDELVGVAGMVVDSWFFKERVLRYVVEKALPKYFDEVAADNLALTVRDGRGRLIIRTAENAGMDPVTHRIGWIFSDWTLGLSSKHTTPEQWAKSNFLLNVSLSGVLAIAVLGGIVLTLRTASREMRLSRMKSDFVSNVSHELRTPLASIRVFGEFLRLGRVDDREKTREYGEFIETESRRLTQLIDNILDFSKIESGAKTYDFQSQPVESVVAETVRTLELGLKHRGFQIVYEGPHNPLPALPVDADAIGQAVSNLVDNAVKYSTDAPRIVVRVDRDATHVRIAVEDHGIGISRAEQDKIFERFHRVSTGLVHDVKGSGLGLSIVHHVVKAHRGRIEVDSEPGRGSTFTIHLPIPRTSAAAAPALAPAGVMGHLEKS